MCSYQYKTSNLLTLDPNAPFLYPLKTPENLTAFYLFREQSKGALGTNGLMKEILNGNIFKISFSRYLKFFLDILVMQKKRLYQRYKFAFQVYDKTTWLKNNCNAHIVISQAVNTIKQQNLGCQQCGAHTVYDFLTV